LPQQPVRILIRSALPRALTIAEVDLDVSGQGKALMVGHLFAFIRRREAAYSELNRAGAHFVIDC
jgi:hypothetical protein